ncbi:MAG: hypothetical protein IJI22_01815 [Bacilli bacterium]|nr:hypothetical protein [Bacilli bacterium]
MKLKKKVKITLFIILWIIVAVAGIFVYKKYFATKSKEVKEVKVVNQVEKYGYTLKENKPAKYKEMFEELKKILNKENVDEEEYVKKITEMFIYDFYSLNDKVAKTDIGGTEFVYNEILENFLKNAQDTYYKYIESNIYNNRKQSLPVVANISIDNVEKKPFAYGNKTDEEAYVVEASWTYTDDQFSSYQNKATLVFIHDDVKLSLVELQ